MKVIALIDITQTQGSLSVLRPRHSEFELDDKEVAAAVKLGIVEPKDKISPTRTSAKNRETK